MERRACHVSKASERAMQDEMGCGLPLIVIIIIFFFFLQDNTTTLFSCGNNRRFSHVLEPLYTQPHPTEPCPDNHYGTRCRAFARIKKWKTKVKLILCKRLWDAGTEQWKMTRGGGSCAVKDTQGTSPLKRKRGWHIERGPNSVFEPNQRHQAKHGSSMK